MRHDCFDVDPTRWWETGVHDCFCSIGHDHDHQAYVEKILEGAA